MKLTTTFQNMVIKAIKDDGSLKINEQDWWTSFTDPKGRVYDVNVYGDEYAEIPTDEFRVAVYAVPEINGEFVTDHEDDLVVFAVMKDALVDVVEEPKRYKVPFWYTTYGSANIVAKNAEEAKEYLDKVLSNSGLKYLEYELDNVIHGSVEAREV